MSDHPPAIEVRDVFKAFDDGKIRALNGTTLTVEEGEFVALVGPSGCGKSTLLHLIAALDTPDSGTIRIRGSSLSEYRDMSKYRALEIGIVFQLDNLLPTLSASENVQIPMFEAGIGARERRRKADRILALVGLTGKERSRPTELSGGERQRVAIARALANDPPILLADEPTGRLDSASGRRILDLLEELRRQRRLTVVLVTHDNAVAARADRIITMLDGRIAGDSQPARAVPGGSSS